MTVIQIDMTGAIDSDLVQSTTIAPNLEVTRGFWQKYRTLCRVNVRNYT
jgi:hypothetical protein